MKIDLRKFSLLIMLLVFGSSLHAQTTADFYFELPEGPDKLVVPVEVAFVNASMEEDLDYSWTVDGETFSDFYEPQLLITESGVHRVCLEVKSGTKTAVECQVLEFFETSATNDQPIVVHSEKHEAL